MAQRLKNSQPIGAEPHLSWEILGQCESENFLYTAREGEKECCVESAKARFRDEILILIIYLFIYYDSFLNSVDLFSYKYFSKTKEKIF
jgi:hypothetical protein